MQIFNIREGGLAHLWRHHRWIAGRCDHREDLQVKGSGGIGCCSIGLFDWTGHRPAGEILSIRRRSAARPICPGGMVSEGTQAVVNGPVHPCFFYESVWCLLGFVLHIFCRKFRRYDGQVFLLYLVWYGFGRFFIEGLHGQPTDPILRSARLPAGGSCHGFWPALSC